MTIWRIELLGGLQFLRDTHPVVLPNRKDRLILAHLALQGGKPVRRARLSGLLWGDRAEEQARASLRQSLAGLRDAFGMDEKCPIVASRESVTLLPQANLVVDVGEFLRLSGGEDSAIRALALYRGPLLDGFDAPTPEFDQWMGPERARFEDAAATLIVNLAAVPLRPEDAAQVLNRIKEMLARDRLREPLYQAAMRILMHEGRWADAARMFKDCCAALEEELGIGPSELTAALNRKLPTSPTSSPAPVPETAIADRPSIAVMPFQNISEDNDLAVLCEGLAEDITAGLGGFRLFTVIDRHSAREVARLTSDAKEIGKKLGVDLVIQGSLQRAANGFRLLVRLVEAESRAQRWAGQFSVSDLELLTAPNQIMAAILPSINAQVETSLLQRTRRKTTLAAYEHLLLGVRHLRGYRPDDNLLAIGHFDAALALDPRFGLAVAYRGFADIVLHGYDSSPPDILQSAIHMVRRAADLDPDEPRIWWLLGHAVSYTRDFELEERCYRKAAALNPNDANTVAALGLVSVARGRRNEGLALFKEAFRLNPYHPEWYWMDYGSALYLCDQYEEALEAYSHRQEPNVWLLSRMAACYAQLGRMAEAQDCTARVLKLKPNFRLQQQRTGSWTPEDSDRFRTGMLKAGLPE